MESESNPYGKILQETFPGFSRKELANIAHSVKQKLDTETLSERFSYHIEQARQEGGKPERLRELVMLFIDKCMINGFEPYSLDLPEALDDRTLFLSNIIYEAYKTHWITPSRTEEAIKLESEAIEDFDREAWNILKTLGEIDRPHFQKIKNSKFSSGVEIITTKESYIRYILSKSWYGQTYTVGDCVKSASEWGLTPDDVPQIVAELNSRRAALDTRDKAWERMQNHTKPLIAKTDERELKSLPSKGIKDTIIDFLVTVWPLTLFLAIGILVLPVHGLSWLLDECTRLSDKKCTEYASWLTVAFWLLIVAGIFFHKWIKKTGRQYKTFILEPIRYLRTLFRRLEKATRPPENC